MSYNVSLSGRIVITPPIPREELPPAMEVTATHNGTFGTVGYADLAFELEWNGDASSIVPASWVYEVDGETIEEELAEIGSRYLVGRAFTGYIGYQGEEVGDVARYTIMPDGTARRFVPVWPEEVR